MTSPISRALDAILTFPARRPVAAIASFAVVLAVAAAGVSRITLNTSLQTMFPAGSPSADAMVRVLERFPASNELVLLASFKPDSTVPTADRPARLLAFADRLGKAAQTSPDLKPLANSVIYRVDAEQRAFAERVIVPAGLYYLDDAGYAEARRRLTPDGMKEQVDRNLSRLAQPGAAGAAAKEFLKDPLGLFELVRDRLFGVRPFKTWQNGGDFVSPDGQAILIRIVGTKPPSDLDYCGELVAAVKAAVAAADTDALVVNYTGAYAAADFSHHAIKADSIESIFVSVFLLQALFLVVYRRPFRQFLLELVPVLLGVFVGFGVYGWLRGGLSPVAAVIGGILAGMGIDYSVLYLAAYFRHVAAGRSPAEAVRLTGRQTVGPMLAAWFTSAIGFVAVGWSSVPTLRDFGLLGALGLAGVFLAVAFALPAVVMLWDTRRLAKGDTPAARRMPFRWDVTPLLIAIHRHRRAFIGSAIVIFLASAVVAGTRPGGPLPLESNVHVMHPQPNPVLAAEPLITERFGSQPGALLVHLTAASPDELVKLAYEVDRRLATPAVRATGITGTAGLASLLPNPAFTANRKPFTDAEADKVVADFRAVMDEAGFEPAGYAAYAEFLKASLTLRIDRSGRGLADAPQPPPSIASFADYPGLKRMLLPSVGSAGGAGPANEAITLVFVDRATDQRDVRDPLVAQARGALAGLPGATLTGLPVISHDTEAATRKDLPVLLGIAGGLVLIVLTVYYRSARRLALALLPLVFSLTVLAAVARLTDTKLNLVNLVALPLLIGIDVDYGIYFVSMAGSKKRAAATQTGEPATAEAPMANRVAASAQAVITCAAASMLGFGSLMAVSVPAVRSLGLVVAVGVVASLVGTFALRAPVLLADEHEA